MLLQDSSHNPTGDRCDRRGDPDALPDMSHMGDEPGFTLYEQPALCVECESWGYKSAREERRALRQYLGTEPEEARS
jgi:hypothetical protein